MKYFFIVFLFFTYCKINAQSNVGIGTNFPSEKLDVDGNIRVTGEIKPNGVSGSNNQVLTSNGSGAMTWKNKTSTATSVYGSSTLTITPTTTTQTLIPGLTSVINLAENSTIYISSTGGLQTTSTANSGVSAVDIFITIDGAIVSNGGYQRVIAANTAGVINMSSSWSVALSANVAAGAHTIEIRAVGVNIAGSSNANVSGNNTSPNQGTLTVMVLQ